MEKDFLDVWETISREPLYIDQTKIAIVLEREEIESCYIPIARWLLQEASTEKRFIVAIAGPPGSGKSIFTTVLAKTIDILNKGEISVCIGLDGWHYSNEYLDTKTIIHNGEPTVLRKIKGSSETFDVAAALQTIMAIKEGKEIDFPIYSRQLHEPIASGGTVRKRQQIILIEGNYLLLDDPPWDKFKDLFNTAIFLEVDPAGILSGLKERHLRGGKTIEFTESHIQNVDLPNILKVLPSIKNAQVIVAKADNRRITGIEWRPGL